MSVQKKSQEASKIMQLLKEKKLKVSRVARFVGVRRATVSDWANNGSTPNLDPARMQRLAVALDLESSFYDEMVLLFQPDQFKTTQELKKEWETTK